MKIITHSGNFHPDEVLGVASLLMLFPEAEVVRTRDEKIIRNKNAGDIVLDVGGIYDASNNYFDHHQEGGAGKRNNDIPYASFGLVWKTYGEKIATSQRAADAIEEKVVWPIDAMDNGIDTFKKFRTDIKPYLFEAALISFLPTWEEKETCSIDEAFMKAVNFSKQILIREVAKANSFIHGEDKVEECYQKAEDKRIVILDNTYSWRDVLTKYEEPLFVIMNDGVQTTWAVSAIRKDGSSFESRKLFPKTWAGKSGRDLAEVTGVHDANFCHNGRFIAVANSKEGALKLAKMAIEC